MMQENISSGANAIISADEGVRRQRPRSRAHGVQHFGRCALRRIEPRGVARRAPVHAVVAQTRRQGSPAQNQSRIYFQISGAGHEAINVAAGLRSETWLRLVLPYYRDRALCLQLGMTPLEMFLAAVGSSKDPSSGGRQMPSHWARRDSAYRVGFESHRHAGACMPSAPADASVIYSRVPDIQDRASHFHADEIAFTSLGDGATSEGEFWEALNATCLRSLPVLFLVEDNGYAISMPVESKRRAETSRVWYGRSPACYVDSTDGTDFLASLRSMREAAAYVRARKARVRARTLHPTVLTLSFG